MKPIAAICLLLALTLASQANGAGKLVIFGDSFSDQENMWTASNHLIPSEEHGYKNGRATNGPNYVDYISQKSPKTKVHNYAFPGATNCFPPIPAFPADWPSPVPKTPVFKDQYEQAKSELRRLKSNDQVWIWMGAYDIVKVMQASYLLTNGAGTNASDTVAAARDVAVCMFEQIKDMLRDGFTKSVTVALLQPLQMQPIWFYATGAEQGDPNFRSMVFSLVDQCVRALNAEIANRLAALASKHKGVRLQLFDLLGLYQDVHFNPQLYGFTNVTWSCLLGDPLTATTEQPATAIGSMCTDPQDYMFWDSSEPTTKMHSIIADYLYPVLKLAGRALD